ncbi:MAG TPA: hypothetical protein VGG64_22930 [Pirellulales bacterium]|jgi:hypothetical protein
MPPPRERDVIPTFRQRQFVVSDRGQLQGGLSPAAASRDDNRVSMDIQVYPEAVDLAFGLYVKCRQIIKEYRNANTIYSPSEMAGRTGHVWSWSFQSAGLVDCYKI